LRSALADATKIDQMIDTNSGSRRRAQTLVPWPAWQYRR
jgi:hypothetical protein